MDFSAMFQTWMGAATNPNDEWYEVEKRSPNASLGTALIWVIIAAVISGLIGLLFLTLGSGTADALDQLQSTFEQFGAPPELQQQLDSILAQFGILGLGVSGTILGIILTPIGFLIGSFITHLVAGLFGGQGEYARYAYLSAAISAPLSIANAVISGVPIAGACISIFVSIYGLVLTFFAVKANYNLSTGRAIGVVLAPVVLLLVLFILLIVVVVAMAAAATGGGA